CAGRSRTVAQQPLPLGRRGVGVPRRPAVAALGRSSYPCSNAPPPATPHPGGVSRPRSAQPQHQLMMNLLGLGSSLRVALVNVATRARANGDCAATIPDTLTP